LRRFRRNSSWPDAAGKGAFRTESMSRAEWQPPNATGEKIGVLNLQGDVYEHLDHLERLNVAFMPVKQVEDFEDLAGLILPGGESTCLARLLRILASIRSSFENSMRG